MLPDVEQSAYDDYEQQRLQQELQQKQQGFNLQAAINEKIAGLHSLLGMAAGNEPPPQPDVPTPPPESPSPPSPAPTPEPTVASPPGEQPPPAPEPAPTPAPLPEPAPTPPSAAEPAPSDAQPAPAPADLPSPTAPVTAPLQPPAGAPAPTQQPLPAAPQAPSSANPLHDWLGAAMGAAIRSGADMQKFSAGLDPSAGDPIGSAMGAALRAGANMEQFAAGLPAAPVPPSSSPGAGAGAAGAPAVTGVPDWLTQLISKNAPSNLASDPDFIRTVAAGAKAESGWDPNRVQNGFQMGSGKGARGLFQFDMGGMGQGMREEDLLGQQGAEYQASRIVPLYVQAYNSAPQGLSGADKASWVAAQAERPLGYDNPNSAARRNYAAAYGEIGGQGAQTGASTQELLSRTGGWTGPANQISQFGQPQLSNDEAYAACGPAAAVRFASVYGRNPTLREATDLAAQVGWNSAQGMAGIGSEKALMDRLGVPTRVVGPDIAAMAREAQTGNPITISTQGHYFFADNYDPQSGAFHVGQSGLDLRGGSEWMTPDQMTARMGPIQGALFADNPQVPAQSTAAPSSSTTPTSITTSPAQPVTTDFRVDRPLQDTYGRLTYAATGTENAPPPQQDQSPVDRLKSAFSDFVDSVRGTSSAPDQPRTGGVAGLLDQAGSALPDITGSLDASKLPGTPLSPGGADSTLGRIAQGQTLSPTEQLAGLPQDVIAMSAAHDEAAKKLDPLRDVPVVGSVLEQATNPLSWVGASGAKGFAGAAGALIGSSAAADLAQRMVADDDPNREAKIALATLVGGLPGATAGERLATPRTLDKLFEAFDTARPPELAAASTQFPSDLAKGAQQGQIPLEGFGQEMPTGGEMPSPAVGGGPGERMAAGTPGLLDQPELKLPSYLPKEVQDMVQSGNASVFDRSGSLDPIVQSLADRVGSTPERILKGWQDNPDAIRAVDQAMSQSENRLGRLQEVLKLDPTDSGALGDVIQELSRYQALGETIDRRLPRAGSLLGDMNPDTIGGQKAILDQVTRLAGEAKMTPEEWTQNLARLDFRDPSRLSNFARITRNYSFADKLQALWYFNLLSSPTTHLRNIVSNTATALVSPVESLGSAAFDPLARRLLGDSGPRQRYAGEALAQYQGMAHSLSSAGADGLQALKYGTPGKGGEITRLAKEPFIGTPLEPLGYTGRALEAEDQFFRGINHGAALRAEAYRTAKQEGLSGADFNARVTDLLAHPSEQMLDNAQKTAAYRVFQSDNDLASAVNQVADRIPLGLGNIVVPFRRTPLNVASYVLERSPLAAGKLLADASTKGGRAALREAGAGELADRLSRMTMGSTMMAGMVKYGLDGNLTGRAPDDPTERDAFYRQGKIPYAFRNPLDGKWYSYQAIQPYSTLIGAAADVADAVKRGQIKDPSDLGGIATVGSMAMARGLLDQPWTQGLTDTLDLLQNGDPDPAKKATRIAGQYLGSAVPGSGLLRTLARMTDNTVRDPADYGPQGVLEQVASNIPYASRGLPAKLDAFGFPTTRPSAFLESGVSPGEGAGLSPFPMSEDSSDIVERELARLAKNPDYNVQPSMVDKNINIGNNVKLPVELTEAQRRKYQETSGQLAYTFLASLVDTDAWKAMPDEQKVKEIDRIYSRSREVARTIMTPDLLEQGLGGLQQQAQRREAVRLPTPAPDQSESSDAVLAGAG